MFQLIHGDCSKVLEQRKIIAEKSVTLTFFDPPFNQGKKYQGFNDRMPEDQYWAFITNICQLVNRVTVDGGSIYFMHREKNTEFVLKCLRETGWTFQNLICWKKKTSAVPSSKRYGKQYQIIVYATKGLEPKVFHRLRINPPLPANYKQPRPRGIFVTDVWDDITELTAGYFSSSEVLRNDKGYRFHQQQSPIALLTRIILASSSFEDLILDPFVGTGTTLVVANQLRRRSIGIDIDKTNINMSRERLSNVRKHDCAEHYYNDYLFTEKLDKIWHKLLQSDF